MAKSKAAKKPPKKVASVKADKRVSKSVKSLAKTASAPVEKAKTKASPKAAEPVLKAAKAPSKVQKSVESAPVAATSAAPKREGQGSTKLSLKLNEKNPAKVAKPARQTRKSKAEELNLEKSNQLSQKWSTLFRKSQDQEAKPYNMRGQFEAKTPIVHKLLGWGYIMANKNDRLEVLFQDGIRYLISNYKS